MLCAQIWNKVKAVTQSDGEGLNRQQFGVALRLVAFVQAEAAPTSEGLIAAASPRQWRAFRGSALPPPRLAPDERWGLLPFFLSFFTL
jgi:hypothetical protein